LAVTGWVTPGSRKELLASGFNDCITKPFTYTALQSAIGKLLEAENQKSKTSEFTGESRDGTKSN
jgi:CheY-like chemotaxis protein